MASTSPSSQSHSLPTSAGSAEAAEAAGTASTQTPPANAAPLVPDEDPGVDLPMTMSASVILTNLPRDASQALQEVERLDGGKGMCDFCLGDCGVGSGRKGLDGDGLMFPILICLYFCVFSTPLFSVSFCGCL